MTAGAEHADREHGEIDPIREERDAEGKAFGAGIAVGPNQANTGR